MRLCSFCSNDNKIASVACETCTYFYCSTCVQRLHPSVGPFQDHRIVKASEFQSKDNVCEEHRERYSVFCHRCMKLLCLKCIAQHTTHHLLNIDEALHSAKESLSSLYQQLEASLKFSTELEKDAKQQRSNLQDLRSEAVKKVKMECKFLRTTICECEKSMVKSIEQEVQEKTSQIDQVLIHIPKVSLSSTKVLNEISGILKQDNIGVVLSKYGTLSLGAKEQLEQLHPITAQDEVRISFNHEEFNCATESRLLTDKLRIERLKTGQSGACSKAAEVTNQSPSRSTRNNAKISTANIDAKFIALLNNMGEMTLRERNGRVVRQRRSVRTKTSKDALSLKSGWNEETDQLRAAAVPSQMNENAHNNSAQSAGCATTNFCGNQSNGGENLQGDFVRDISELLEIDGCCRHTVTASLPPTTAGITQRWKGGYYSNYTLTSDRLRDSHFQQLVNGQSPHAAQEEKEDIGQETTL